MLGPNLTGTDHVAQLLAILTVSIKNMYEYVCLRLMYVMHVEFRMYGMYVMPTYGMYGI